MASKKSFERYVSQQETFRNAPALRPEASPTNTAVREAPLRPLDQREIKKTHAKKPVLPAEVTPQPEAPRPAPPPVEVRNPQQILLDPRAKTKADILLDTIGSLTPALKAYVDYKTEMGKLDQKEQMARAILGLPQTPGRGFDRFGDVGYSLGAGEAAGARFKAEYDSLMTMNSYGVDQDGNPDVAIKFRKDTFDALVQKHAGENTDNAAFMEGFHKHALEAKILGDTKGEQYMASMQLQKIKQDLGDSMDGAFGSQMESFDEARKTTEGYKSFLATFREKLNSHSATAASTLRVSRAAANEAIIDTIRNRGVAYALAGDVPRAMLMKDLVSVKDASGFSLTSKKLSLNYEQAAKAVKEIDSALDDVAKKRIAEAKLLEDSSHTNVIRGIMTGDIKTDADILKAGVFLSGSGLKSAKAFLKEVKSGTADADVTEDPTQVGRLILQAREGTLSPETIMALRESKKLMARTTEHLLDVTLSSQRANRAEGRAVVNFQNAQLDRQQRLKDAEEARKRTNESAIDKQISKEQKAMDVERKNDLFKIEREIRKSPDYPDSTNILDQKRIRDDIQYLYDDLSYKRDNSLIIEEVLKRHKLKSFDQQTKEEKNKETIKKWSQPK